MSYKFGGASEIIRKVDGAVIPRDWRNVDYLAYLEWERAGNVPDAYVAPPVSALSKLAFLDRFTDDELGSILDAGKQARQVAVFIKKMELAGDIRLDDARTIAGVQALESAGLIGPGRAAQILAG